MTSPSGTCSSVALASLSGLPSLIERDLHRRAANLEPGAIELRQDRAGDAVLHFADAVFGDDEADGELEPVVGERPEHARLERFAIEAVSFLEPPARTGGVLRETFRRG